MTNIASDNQSFFNSIIDNTNERITTKLITFHNMVERTKSKQLLV